MRRWTLRVLRGHRGYADLRLSTLRHALDTSADGLVGVGQLAARHKEAYFPLPKPFGLHCVRGYEVHELLQNYTNESRSDVLTPSASVAAHSSYAVANEFPWFPFLSCLETFPEAKEAVASAILQALPEGSKLGRRWWFAYELFFERLQHPDWDGQFEAVPFLPPERFFCTSGRLSARHGVLDNLLGGKDFCPTVEKFAGAEEAVETFRAELMDVLSPICMMTVKDFLTDAGLRQGAAVDEEKWQRLLRQLTEGGLSMTVDERAELREQLGGAPMDAGRLVNFASWLRGESALAFRLREHLLGVEPIDLQWHAPGEVFLDRLSRVISSVETRASQLLEGELPPDRKERFFVDAISKPWTRSDVVVNMDSIARLQQGLLSTGRYEEVQKTQVKGEPRRTTQNWISSEKHDDEYGKEIVLHYLPPPPNFLPELYKGYFECVHRMLEDPDMDPIVCATIAKIALNTLHPMADGNGRVQRMIFQLVLFRFNFLPRVNIPVSVVMLQDRTGYEVMQWSTLQKLMTDLGFVRARVHGRRIAATKGSHEETWAASGIAKTFKNDATRGVSYAKVGGVWILARLRGLGRVVIGSLHCHTGATNAIYQSAILQYIHDCPSKWRQYPAWCGVDTNELLPWTASDAGSGQLANGSSNLNELANQLSNLGIQAIAPKPAQWSQPSHFPRDRKRRGRQIDATWSRHLQTSPTVIDPERRHVIGTDHAILFCDVFTKGRSFLRWGNDSRPRYVTAELPETIIVDAKDLSDLARTCSAPRRSSAYCDPTEVTDLIKQAQAHNDPQAWKRVHRVRRQARRLWHHKRLTKILHGNWHEYRLLQKERKRKTGWWGGLLQKSSSKELTARVQSHLESKLVNEFGCDWDELLDTQIQTVELRGEFVPFSILDIRVALQDMKTHSAVGPDGISVHFLRVAASDDTIAPQLLELVNHIASTCELPEIWRDNFLALIAKVDFPSKPTDLRPICVSSAFHKMINKMICARVMPTLRSGSLISGCGKGRQAADVIGAIGRVRDVTVEWQLPTLLCKLDISGAFDKLDRMKVVEYLKTRLRDKDLEHELRYLLAQLFTYKLVGQVPGGDFIQVEPNVGIKQGAPESAEVFGLVMDDILSRLTSHRAWGDFGLAFDDCEIELVFYQDDIFLIESELVRLGKKVKVLERCLEKDGLHLATEKTKIVSSAFYRGAKKVQVGGSTFQVAPAHESVKVLGLSFSLREKPSQQARELLGRTRDAAMVHRDILRGHANWEKKVDMMRTLVESQFAWTAGAVHWSPEDLRQANMLQIHTMRTAFRISRQADERWHEWNARSMRTCRELRKQCSPRPSRSFLFMFALALPVLVHLAWSSPWDGSDEWRPTQTWDEWESTWEGNPSSSTQWTAWHQHDGVNNVASENSQLVHTPSPSSLQPTASSPLTDLPLTCASSSTCTAATHLVNHTQQLMDTTSASSSTWIPPSTTSCPSGAWSSSPPSSSSTRRVPNDPPACPAPGHTASWSTGVTSPLPPSQDQLRPWTREEIMLRMAEAWDEELCWGLQEEAIVEYIETETAPNAQLPDEPVSLPPIPEDLPLPFELARQCADLSAVDTTGQTWWDQVRDRRQLRGQDGFQLRRDRVTYNRSNAGTTVLDTPSTSSSSSSQCPANVGTPANSNVPTAPAQEADDDTSSSSSTVTGITQRWGVQRPGVDRWHYPNGTIRRRLHEAGTTQAATSPTPPTSFNIEGVVQHPEGPALKARTFYGDAFEVWASGATVSQNESSTTAGDGSLGDSEEGWTSSTGSASSTDVGFYRHGVWHPRHRTASEQRAHRGGSGEARMSRKAARVAEYLAGSWKPAWLKQYAREKEARQAAQRAEASTGSPPHVLDEEETTDIDLGHSVSVPSAEPLPPPTAETWENWSWTGWREFEDGQQSWSWHADGTWSWRGNDGTWDWWSGYSSTSSTSRDDGNWEWWSWQSSTSSTTSTINGTDHHLWSQEAQVQHHGVTLHWITSSSPWVSVVHQVSMLGSSIPWITSTTSTTTLNEIEDPPTLPPNAGLFPDVFPIDPETHGRMSITNGEVATLQEYGVSQSHIRRVSDLLDALDRQERMGLGAESRWAFERLLQRASEGADAQQAILQVLRRRLLPRGLLPITRVPRTEALRWNMFSWVRQFIPLFLDNMEQHLRTPLQPHEGEISSSSAEGSLPRSRSRSPRGANESTGEHESDLVGDDTMVDNESTSALPTAALAHLAPVELQGIWQEPVEESTLPDPQSSSSTWMGELSSTTSTTSSSSSSTMYDLNCWVVMQEDVEGNCAHEEDLLDEHSFMQQSLCSLQSLVLPTSTTSTTTTSPWTPLCTTLTSSTFLTVTTTTTSRLSTEDAVRDEVNHQLVISAEADVPELLRRLLVHQRRLLHLLRLTQVALDEALRWIQVPREALPLNANVHERRVWTAIVREVCQTHLVQLKKRSQEYLNTPGQLTDDVDGDDM
ncbi:unnamed protein product [Symbiodinium sp. CCMP2592]|nr:unnamed protein product [Symbiodinium sp. CCMP2592]